MEAFNHTCGTNGTGYPSPRNGLDWHRSVGQNSSGVPVDGLGVSGTHSTLLLTADLQAKLAAREASVRAGSAKPLFVYVGQTATLALLATNGSWRR